MSLSDELVLSLVRDGFLHLERVVGESKVAAANRFLNHLLGRCGELQGGGLQGEGWGKFGGGHAHAPAVRDLYFGEVQRIVSELICADDANLSGQIALRFPEYRTDITTAAEEEETPMWHTDGLRQGKYHPFSLLVGACLSDVPEERGSGNLLVYPASHHIISRAITGEHGAIDVGLLRSLLGGESNPSAPAAPPAFHDNEPAFHNNEPELPIPGAVKGFVVKAGDVLLLHPDLPHCGDRNFSCEVRKMVYFRIKCKSKLAWEDVAAAHRKFAWSDFSPRVQRIAAEFCGLSSHHHLPLPPSQPSSSSSSSSSAAAAVIQLKDKQLMSRLLYANPVCMLSTLLPAQAEAAACNNVMICSWLTCVDNRGGVFLSINEKRTSALAFTQPWSDEWAPVWFVLSIPTSELEAVILRVGSCHGSSVDKFGTIEGLSPCAAGWTPSEEEEKEKEEEEKKATSRPPAVAECVAHIVLVAASRPTVTSGHLYVFAEMKQAWVKAAYWDGKCFAPRKKSLAPLISFNGTKCFSALTPLFQPGGKGGL